MSIEGAPFPLLQVTDCKNGFKTIIFKVEKLNCVTLTPLLAMFFLVFLRTALWYWCRVAPRRVTYNDDRVAYSNKTARSSLVCWLIHSVIHGCPHPVTLGEWCGLCGLYCEVIWEETASWAPSKYVILSQLTCQPPRHSRRRWLFMQHDCPHVDHTGRRLHKSVWHLSGERSSGWQVGEQ